MNDRLKFRGLVKLKTQSILLYSSEIDGEYSSLKSSDDDFNNQIYKNGYKLTQEDKDLLWSFSDKDDYYPWSSVECECIEQCTGLKDKNGKLIYEGDILFVKTLDWKKKERWDAEEVKTYWSVEYKNYWNHCGFMVFGINRRFHKPLTRTVIFNSEAEVIGNIHQNPELLKDSK